MAQNESLRHLKRWIKASFLKEFKLHTKGQRLYVEGEDRLTNKEYQFIEFRLDGPYVTPNGTAGEYRAYIEVNLLVSSTRNEANKYNRENLQGLLMYILNRDVCIFRTGNAAKEDTDDGSYIEIMQLMPSEMIKTSDFGQIDPNTQLYQAVAEAHYEMYFRL